MATGDKNINISINFSSVAKVFFVGLLFVGLYYVRDLVLVVLTAIVIATFVDLILQKFSNTSKNRVLWVVAIYFIGTGILLGLLYFFIPVFVSEFSGLTSLLSNYIPSVDTFTTMQNSAVGEVKEITSGLNQNLSIGDVINASQALASHLSSGFLNAVGVIFGGFLNLILIFVLSFLFSTREKGIEGFLRIIVPENYEDYAVDIWTRTERRIGLWVQGQFILSLLVGLIIYLGLMILNVKYALIISLITALLELVPFGFILAGVPAMIFAYVDGGMGLSLWVAGLYLIVHEFEAYLLQPLVMKKIVGISPLIVILSLLVGAKIAGIWGVILAVPMAVLALEFAGDIEKRKVMSKEAKVLKKEKVKE